MGFTAPMMAVAGASASKCAQEDTPGKERSCAESVSHFVHKKSESLAHAFLGTSAYDDPAYKIYRDDGSISAKIVRSGWFKALVGLIIAGYCVVLGLEVEFQVTNVYSPEPLLYVYLDILFTILFTVEFAVRVAALKSYNPFYLLQTNSWFCLEFVIVLVLVVDTSIEIDFEGQPPASRLHGKSFAPDASSSIRMLRLFAVFRLTTFSTKVQGFMTAMKQAVFVMIGMVFVFSFIFYIFTLTMMQMSVRYKLYHECFEVPDVYSPKDYHHYIRDGFTAANTTDGIDCSTFEWPLDTYFSTIGRGILSFVMVALFWDGLSDMMTMMEDVGALDMEILFVFFVLMTIFLIMGFFSSQLSAVIEAMNSKADNPNKIFVHRLLNQFVVETNERHPNKFPYKTVQELQDQNPTWYKDIFDDGEVASCLSILDLNPTQFLQYGPQDLKQMRVAESIQWFFDANVKNAEKTRKTQEQARKSLYKLEAIKTKRLARKLTGVGNKGTWLCCGKKSKTYISPEPEVTPKPESVSSLGAGSDKQEAHSSEEKLDKILALLQNMEGRLSALEKAQHI